MALSLFQELSRQQRALQSLEQESVQTKGKLSQELQQAKNHCNSLQAELDKVGPCLPLLSQSHVTSLVGVG